MENNFSTSSDTQDVVSTFQTPSVYTKEETPSSLQHEHPPQLKNLFSLSDGFSQIREDIGTLKKPTPSRTDLRSRIYAFTGSNQNNRDENIQPKSETTDTNSFKSTSSARQFLDGRNSNKQNIQSFQVVNEASTSRQPKNKVKIEVKSEIDETKESIKALESLAAFQKNFNNQCEIELQALQKHFNEKTSSIEETNSKIENISFEIKKSSDEFENEYNKLVQEAKALEQACEELKKLNEIEDERYQVILTDHQNINTELQLKVQENCEIEREIQIQEADNFQKECYLEQLQASLAHYQRLHSDLEIDIKDIFDKKRVLNNELQELKGNIRVYCRIRPFLASDALDDVTNDMLKIKTCTSLDLTVPQSCLKSENNIKEYKFNFEHIFDHNAKQIDIFNELSQLIQSALDGYNVCIFAYGQTGSGKTYTMEGNSNQEETRGIIVRSVDLIFDQIKYMKNFGWEYNIFVSFQEIYNEQARDLLTNTPDSKSEISYVEVKNQQELRPLLKLASENRAVAETQCNEHSSRSHSIFQLKLKGRNEEAKQEANGTLNLIDLAGSERLAISKAEGERLKETQSINKSLTSLGDVITALANKEKHIPYRNSKLTYVLQPYLGGDSKTLMLVNLSPLVSNFHQTLCTLRFAHKVKSCEIGTAKKNMKNF